MDRSCVIRTYLKTLNHLQKGKYIRRTTYYIYLCIDCKCEVETEPHALKRATGRCRICTDKIKSKKLSKLNSKRPFEALYNKFMYDRKRANKECDITYEDFLIFTEQKVCAYCFSDVRWAEKSLSTNGYSYNLDRMDNNKGYLKDNCIVCCWDCNQTKSSRFTYEEFILLAPTLKLIKEKRKCSSLL